MADISIFYGSVYGNAQDLAFKVADKLKAAGHNAKVVEDPKVDDFRQAQVPLIISSTTGQGDIPPNLEFFIYDLRDQFPLLEGRSFAVIALGDSSYDTYCGAGEQIFELMLELQGKPLAELLRIDAIETLEPETEALPWLDSWLDKLPG